MEDHVLQAPASSRDLLERLDGQGSVYMWSCGAQATRRRPCAVDDDSQIPSSVQGSRRRHLPCSWGNITTYLRLGSRAVKLHLNRSGHLVLAWHGGTPPAPPPVAGAGAHSAHQVGGPLTPHPPASLLGGLVEVSNRSWVNPWRAQPCTDARIGSVRAASTAGRR